MNGIYWVVKSKETGKSLSPPGVSKAPHLYLTEGKANVQHKRLYQPHLYEVIPVVLTEMVKGGK